MYFRVLKFCKLFIKNIAEIPISDPLLNPKRISSFDVNSIMLYNFPQEIWIQE